MRATLREIWWKSSVLSTVFLIAAVIVSPPDVISQITLAAGMGIVYGVVSLIVRRFEWFKRAPETSKRSIAVAVCLFSILVGFCTVFIPRALNTRPTQSQQVDGKEYQE